MSVEIKKVDKGTGLERELLAFVENCSWVEVKDHVAEVIRNGALSGWETFFAALEDGHVCGMAAVLKTDYYPLPDVFPWVSCIFVSEDRRGRGICGELISSANRYLKSLGFDRSYIPTEAKGLYEHYGYRYVREIVNYAGGTDRLYMKEL